MSSLQEKILVVQRSVLFCHQTAWHGLDATNTDMIISRIINNQEYMQRSLAEINPAYKQIIPYVIFTYAGKYFVMERKKTASEQRVAGKLSMGIGGHMRQEDMQGKTIFDWAQREFYEEVTYNGTLTIESLGILNDDTNEVGRVHLGVVLLAHAEHGNISIQDEHKQGYLISKQECLDLYDTMESWSQFVIDILP